MFKKLKEEDNYILHSICRELVDLVNKKDKEIKRLNNIINQMESELFLNLPFKVVGVRHLLNLLKKLKGE